MHQGTNANQQSNVEAQIVVVGPPLLPVLHKGQKVASVYIYNFIEICI